MASRTSGDQAIHIGGIPVNFPCKPYGTQLSMMAKIIKGIDRRQNCLLESPTGSGKSLALLCSSLGWQSHEHKKQVIARESRDSQLNERHLSSDEDPCVKCTCHTQHKDPLIDLTGDSPPGSLPGTGDINQRTVPTHQGGVDETDDAADFRPPKMNLRTPNAINAKSRKKAMGVVFDDDDEDDAHTSSVTPVGKLPIGSCTCSCHKEEEKKCKEITNEEEEEKIRLPKIFFGTRTHKQIAQIIRELKKTAYADTKMAILGSREHLCVHPEVSKSKNKNDGCRELLDTKNGISCRYYNNVQKMKFHWQLQGLGLPAAWDVEDLVKVAKKVKACSYFASRSLANDADIVFCPYNYLIDPLIRSSMEITLKGQIIILDEAHNIEDSAREAASVTIMADELQDTIDELDRLIKYHWREEHCRVMHTVVANLQRWINSHTNSLSQNDFSKASRVWSGVEMVAAFSTMGVSPASFDTLKHHLAALFEEANPQIPVEQMVALTSASGMLIKSIFVIVDYFFRENMVYMKDYKVVLIKEISRRKFQENTDNRWVNPRRGNHERFTYSLNFWCLNPAVAFSDVGGEARTIILTSGTLSPMGSFASELGVRFDVSLEANHVIKDSQVWVGSIATGPTGKTLNASYRNTETFNFQDDLGRLILDVCKAVPYGVLCFLSSYSLMLKLSERWKNTGLWGELESRKVVMTEARGGQKREFDEQLKEFYNTIEDFERGDMGDGDQTGVLFFAVCRGKVSEGMDFADNNARAVITVGIPFPSFKDPQVELKRAYNDQNRERGLLSGSEWYEIQAYRALNQALGRCLRHRNDWGALILVDERFRRNPQKYINGLSKWVRTKVNHFLYSADGMDSLKNFVTRQQNTVINNEKSSPTGSQIALDVTLTTPSVDSRGPGMPSIPVTPISTKPSGITSTKYRGQETPSTPYCTSTSRPTAVMHGFPAIATIAKTPSMPQLLGVETPSTPQPLPTRTPSIAAQFQAKTLSTPEQLQAGKASYSRILEQLGRIADGERMQGVSHKSQQAMVVVKEDNSDSSNPQSLVGAQIIATVEKSDASATPLPGSSFIRHQPAEAVSIKDSKIQLAVGQGNADSPSEQSMVGAQKRTVERVDPAATPVRTSFQPYQTVGTRIKQALKGANTKETLDTSEPEIFPGGSTARNMDCMSESHSFQSSSKKTQQNLSHRPKLYKQSGLGAYGFQSTQNTATKLTFTNREDAETMELVAGKSIGAITDKEEALVGNTVDELQSKPLETAFNLKCKIQGQIGGSASRDVEERTVSPLPRTGTPSPLFIEESDDGGEMDCPTPTNGGSDSTTDEMVAQDTNEDKVLIPESEKKAEDIKDMSAFGKEIKIEADTIFIVESDGINPNCSVKMEDKENNNINFQGPETMPCEIITPSKKTPKRSKRRSRLSRSSKRSREGSDQEGESVTAECEGEGRGLIRRSKRSRRATYKVKTELDRVTDDDVTRVSCTRCDAMLCDSGVTKVLISEVQSCYLADQVFKLPCMRTSPRKRNPLKSSEEKDFLLRLDPGGSYNIEVKQTKRRDTTDVNAHWSEKDDCCYQPLVCSKCGHNSNGTTVVIGHRVVASGPIKSGLVKGQIWLFPSNVCLT